MDNNYLPISFFQLINPDNTMSCNRFIAHAIGATETIIYFSLISKMTYYYKNGMLDDEGFFYATAIDIQESTTFTKRQQMPAINRLVEIGLIKTKSAGLPKKKYYKVLNNQELILTLIEKGEAIAEELHNKVRKPHKNQKLQNVTSCDDKMLPLEETKCNDSELQNVTSCGNKMSPLYKTKDNKLNIIKPNPINQSIGQITVEEASEEFADRIDRIDGNTTQQSLLAERKKYEELVARNIFYEDLLRHGKLYDRDMLKAIYAVIVDSICSTEAALKIAGGYVPQEVVKEMFLKLECDHVEYVMEMLKEFNPDIRNIPAYLRTALYNAVSTIDMHYTSELRAEGIIK